MLSNSMYEQVRAQQPCNCVAFPPPSANMSHDVGDGRALAWSVLALEKERWQCRPWHESGPSLLCLVILVLDACQLV